MKIALSPAIIAPQDNAYLAIGGLPAVVVDPETRVQQAKAVGSVVYEGLKTVVEGLYDCSDIFLPLKTAAGGILTIIKFVEVCVLTYDNTDSLLILADQTVLENKKELEDLKAKLEAILSIVKKYQKHDGVRALSHRIEIFCTSVAFSWFFSVMFIFINAFQCYHHPIEVDRGHAEAFTGGPWGRG